MKIAVNVDKLSRTDKRGVSVYIYQILNELSRIDQENEYLLYTRRDFVDKPFMRNPRFSIKIIESKLGLPYWTYVQLSRQAIRDKADVFFSPAQNVPYIFKKPKNIKIVTSILDLAFKKFPEHFDFISRIGLEFNTEAAVRNSDKIIAISLSTKKDLMEYYGINSDKIEVVHLASRMEGGVENPGKACENKNPQIKSPYILFVGTMQPRKNLIRLIEAFEKARKNSMDVNLVICGEKGWLYEKILARIKKSEFSKNICVLGGISEDDLRNLYCGARAFILPSLYEGFGIPVLEAMSFGVPVLVPRNSSFPEVAKNAALYINEFDAGDIAGKIEKITNDQDLRNKLSEEGRSQSKNFSWKEAAKKHLNIFMSLR